MTASNSHPEASAGQHVRTLTSTRGDSEVHALLRDLKGKNLEEVLGIDSHGTLARAVVQATAGTLLLMVVFSAGPLVWGKLFSPPKQAAVQGRPEVEKADLPRTDPATVKPATKEGTAAAPTKGEPKQPLAGKDVLEKLGVTETKPADPKVNPLEKGVDDLLKDLDKK